MAAKKFREAIQGLLAEANIAINGDRPWDIRVHNEKLYSRIMADGALGLGEAFMDGWWESERIDDFFYHLLRTDLDRKNESRTWRNFFSIVQAKAINRQSRQRAYQVGRTHYNIGNDLYRGMLDRRMIYSCGYWKDAATLDAAQEAKLDLVCRKLELRAGMRVLDIGCGWGGTARFAAEHYGAHVVGITISTEQAALAREICEGLPIEIRLQDYREVDEKFERVLSLGMFEHVGYKNYPDFMRVVRRNLVPNGLFLLHTIGGNRSTCCTDPWFERYIFPNSMLPSARQLCAACEGVFLIEDWHNFGADYDRTLMHWYANFAAGWPAMRQHYDERFYRMWTYYLLSCAGAFRARKNQVWQILLSPRGVPGGHRSVR